MEVNESRVGRWRLTGYYGYANRAHRRHYWDLIRHLAGMSQLSWCLFGDFNDLLSPDDKWGRCDHPPYLMRRFRNAILDAHLIDLDMVGYPFTWRFGLEAPNIVEQRFDRAFATSSWFNAFPQALLYNMLSPKSDHSPLLLTCVPFKVEWRATRFRFENSWLAELELSEVVHDGWNKGGGYHVLVKIDSCASALTPWGRSIRMWSREDIEDCKKQLEQF